MRLSSALPKDIDLNGLAAIRSALLNDPAAGHLVIALVDCAKTTVDHDTGQKIPTVRVMRIEAITDPDREALLQTWMREAFQERRGELELPFEPDPKPTEETPR